MATVIVPLHSKDRVEPVNVGRAFLLWFAIESTIMISTHLLLRR